MMNLLTCALILLVVVSSDTFLVIPTDCEGCEQWTSETGEIKCNCSQTSHSIIPKNIHNIDNNGHHVHTTHPHYHNQHATGQPFLYSTESPTTMNVPTDNPSEITTSKCDPGCELRFHPKNWHYCYCTTTASPQNTDSLLVKAETTTISTDPPEFSSEMSTSLLLDILTSTHSQGDNLQSTKLFEELSTTKSADSSTSPSSATVTSKTTLVSTILTTSTTTADICVILCAAQIGGDACNCSKPGLPG